MTVMGKIQPQPAANEVYRLPPPMFDARCRACWMVVALVVLVVASFWSLDLPWARFFSFDSLTRMGRFAGELTSPAHGAAFLRKLLPAAVETLAMSVVGTLLAIVGGLLLALPASKLHAGDRALWRGPTRLLLNALRSVPELMWAALLLIAAGLGPFAGTLRRALSSSRVGPRQRAGSPACSLLAGSASSRPATTASKVPTTDIASVSTAAGNSLRRNAAPCAGDVSSPAKRPMRASESMEKKRAHCRSSDQKLATTSTTSATTIQQARQRASNIGGGRR